MNFMVRMNLLRRMSHQRYVVMTFQCTMKQLTIRERETDDAAMLHPKRIAIVLVQHTNTLLYIQHVASHLYYCFHVVSLKSLIHVKLSNECSMKNCCSAFTSHDENLNLAIFQDSSQIVISSRSLYTETLNLSFG